MPQTIAVVGLGYIGLPLSLTFCEKGINVIGVDIDDSKIGELRQGHTDVHENYQGETLEQVLGRNLDRRRFTPTSNVADAREHVHAYVVTVGIPVGSNGDLNPRPMFGMADSLGPVLKQGDLVLIRSTMIPGLLEDEVIPRLEKHSGLTAGSDFHVAYAAERVAEGRAIEEFQTLDIVLAGLTETCGDVAEQLLSQLTSGTIHRTNLRIAQAVKVIENVQRDANIAIAQEIAKYAGYHGVDVQELIKMANTHPRVQILTPGIGVGGFCIPNAYHYLKGSLKAGQELPLLELARSINFQVPSRVIDKLEEKLKQKGKKLQDSVVIVLGLGMKDFSNDIRLSPAVDCLNLLVERGATVKAFDPTVPLTLETQVATLDEALQGADGLLVGAWQHEFDEMNIGERLREAGLTDTTIDLKHFLRTSKAQ